MTLNSPLHEIYLEMPLDAQMMPQLEGLPFWARTVHEVMFQTNPKMMFDLAQEDKLKQYLLNQQSRLKEEAMTLEREWRLKNPLPEKAKHQERTAWHNHAKMSAREQLIELLRKSMEDHAEALSAETQTVQ